MTASAPRLLIAEDEPLLAAGLQRALAAAWPQATVVATAGDGASAIRLALAERPDVCFLDIRMPGPSGLEAARALAEDWPEDAGPLPLLVFVTAYDQHAVAAFEASAADYLLKPVQAARLERTIQRLQERLAARGEGDLERLGQLLRSMTGPGGWADARARDPEPAWLRRIPVGSGPSVRLLPVDQVLLFEAADKYVRILTADGEHLIRTPLKDLLPQLDPAVFWQIHRGRVVRADAIEQALHDESGRITLVMRGLGERPVVSRLHAGRFRPM